MEDCLFCKIVRGEIPSNKIFEDNDVLAFLDIAPVNQGHVLVIPKIHSIDMLEMSEDTTEKLFVAAKKIAPAVMKGVSADGFNLGVSTKKTAGQVIFHTHIHIMPRFVGDGLKLWHGKAYSDNEAEKVRDAIVENL